MNETQKQKLHRFVNDVQMFETVREVIENEVLKPSKDRDVQNLAARFMALEILRDSWKELDKYKEIISNNENTTGNVGL